MNIHSYPRVVLSVILLLISHPCFGMLSFSEGGGFEISFFNLAKNLVKGGINYTYKGTKGVCSSTFNATKSVVGGTSKYCYNVSNDIYSKVMDSEFVKNGVNNFEKSNPDFVERHKDRSKEKKIDDIVIVSDAKKIISTLYPGLYIIALKYLSGVQSVAYEIGNLNKNQIVNDGKNIKEFVKVFVPSICIAVYKIAKHKVPELINKIANTSDKIENKVKKIGNEVGEKFVDAVVKKAIDYYIKPNEQNNITKKELQDVGKEKMGLMSEKTVEKIQKLKKKYTDMAKEKINNVVKKTFGGKKSKQEISKSITNKFVKKSENSFAKFALLMLALGLLIQYAQNEQMSASV